MDAIQITVSKAGAPGSTTAARHPRRARIGVLGRSLRRHYVYIDRQHDLVVVLRWTPDLAGVVTRVIEALESPDQAKARQGR